MILLYQKWIESSKAKNTFNASGWSVFKRVRWHGNRLKTRWSVWDGSYFRRSLAQVGPIVRVGVVKAIGHGTVAAIYDLRTI